MIPTNSRTPSAIRITLLARTAFTLYTITLLYALLRPQLSIIGPIPRTDLILHASAYAIWTWLLAATAFIPNPKSTRTLIIITGIASAFSILSELAQGIPGVNRVVTPTDAAANLLGIALAITTLILLAAPRRDTPTPNKQHSPEQSETALGTAVRTLSSITLLSRTLGLARDILLVRVFGNTAIGSAFAAAFAIPNLFRRLFGEGALSAAFLPEYSDAHANDPNTADRFASVVILLTALVTGALLVFLELTLWLIIQYAPGSTERVESLQLVMLLLPFMPLVCISAVLGGVLHVHGRFAPTAAAPLLLNIFLILGAYWHFSTNSTDQLNTARLLGLLTVTAGVAQVLWSLTALRARVTWSLNTDGVWDRALATAKKFLPVLLGLGAIQLNTFTDTLIAMWPNWIGPTIAGHNYPLPTDANAVLFFTQRLYQFPLGVFGIAVATAIFPLLAKQSKDPDNFRATLRRGIRLSLFISLPATAGLILIRTDLIDALFAGKSSGFDPSGVARAAAVLLGYAVAIWAYSLNHVLTRAFYAQGDTTTPMRIAVATVILNLPLNLILIWPLAEAGLAWSTATCAILQTVLLYAYLRKRLQARILTQPDTKAITTTILNTAIMTLFVALSMYLLTNINDHASNTTRLAIACTTGILTYAALARITKRPELSWLLHPSKKNS